MCAPWDIVTSPRHPTPFQRQQQRLDIGLSWEEKNLETFRKAVPCFLGWVMAQGGSRKILGLPIPLQSCRSWRARRAWRALHPPLDRPGSRKGWPAVPPHWLACFTDKLPRAAWLCATQSSRLVLLFEAPRGGSGVTSQVAAVSRARPSWRRRSHGGEQEAAGKSAGILRRHREELAAPQESAAKKPSARKSPRC